jgi:hypothetical protein
VKKLFASERGGWRGDNALIPNEWIGQKKDTSRSDTNDSDGAR